MIEQAERIGAKNTRIVSTPVSSVFTDHEQKEYSGELKRVLFAGRLAPEKNIEALLKAAEEHPNTVFTVAGEGPLRDQIEENAARLSNFNYVGWLDRESLREQIDQHDALVLPSHFESFGTIALEAMARQRLVIVSKHCGIVEWEEYNQGLQVIEDTLSDTLSSLANRSPELRTQLAETAKNVTEEINKASLKEWCDLLLESSLLN